MALHPQGRSIGIRLATASQLVALCHPAFRHCHHLFSADEFRAHLRLPDTLRRSRSLRRARLSLPPPRIAHSSLGTFHRATVSISPCTSYSTKTNATPANFSWPVSSSPSS